MDLSRWLPQEEESPEEIKESSQEVEIDEPKPMPTNGDLPGACRVQSPSSILTHKQCPRKYFYRYIERLPGPKSIHLIRGCVVHKVLEDVYDVDFSRVPADGFFHSLKVVLQEMFRKEWYASAKELGELDLSPEDLEHYFEESQLMVDNFYHYVYERMRPLLPSMSPHEAWAKLMPERELKMQSPTHLVRGFIDVVQEELDGTLAILDYKTSKKLAITPEYRLQLGIYAMMQEEHNLPADEVGVIFLKHGQEIRLPVTPELVSDAKQACLEVQMNTKSTSISDYPMRPSPLCKWRTGQCEYYDLCFTGQSVADYREKMTFQGRK